MTYRIQILALSIICACSFVSEVNAHTKWNYYNSDWECRDYKGQKVATSYCRPKAHGGKVCRAKDNHDHGKDFSVGDQNFETKADADKFARENGGRVRERGDGTCDGKSGRNCN